MRVFQYCLLITISASLLFNSAQSTPTSRDDIVSDKRMDSLALGGHEIVLKNKNTEATATSKSKKIRPGYPADKVRSGDGTFYATGLGSCGKVSKSTDLMVALPISLMRNGDNPNNNPLCGLFINAKGPNGVTIKVEVLDSCVGCSPGDLDFSPTAFSKLGEFATGRIPITWEWA